MKRDAFTPGAVGELTFGSICSGIEAASVAWGPLGWRAAWLAEIDPFARAVLAHHYPKVPNLGDMTTIARCVLTGEVPAPDILCGGTPCQAFSVAGLRESLADARGNLTLKFVELADAIDHVRGRAGLPPASVFWENVPGVLSTKDNAFGCFLAGLAGEDEPLQPPGGKWANAGCVYGPTRAIAWRTLDAQYFGLAQRRRRVFVVASARKGFDPAQVLFEWDGVRRDTAPSRESGQEVAPTIRAGAPNGGPGHGARSGDSKDELIVPHTAHTLRGEGFDASVDGTGRGTPLVPVAYATKLHNTTSNQAGKFYENYTASLDANSPPPAIVFDTTQITSKANGSNPQPGDPCHPLSAGAHPPAIAIQDARGTDKAQNGRGWNADGVAYTLDTHATQGVAVAFPANLSGTQYASAVDLAPSMGAANPTAVAVSMRESGQGYWMEDDIAGTLRAEGENRPSRPSCVIASPSTDMQVRRLTPVECERLQGFPDGYTAIPWRGKPSDQCPDGPRYKALGNSWAIDVIEWIGQRLQQHLARL